MTEKENWGELAVGGSVGLLSPAPLKVDVWLTDAREKPLDRAASIHIRCLVSSLPPDARGVVVVQGSVS